MTSDGRSHCVALAVVAEDQPLLRMDLADTLAEAGFEVLEAASAPEAIHQLSTHPGVALLVTDVQMPGGTDGFVLAREAAERWPAMRIVVSSAYARPLPGQMPEGARFLDKPYSAELVTDLLRDMGVV